MYNCGSVNFMLRPKCFVAAQENTLLDFWLLFFFLHNDCMNHLACFNKSLKKIIFILNPLFPYLIFNNNKTKI
jgi:hypothetical protein